MYIAKETVFQKITVGSEGSVALEFFQNELNHYNQKDRQVAASLSHACESDGEILQVFRQVEAQAVQDRQLAARLSQNGRLKTESVVNQTRINTGACSSKSISISPSKDTAVVNADASSKSIAISEASSSKDNPKSDPCVSCMNPIKSSFKKFPCNHLYCEECFKQLVQASLLDISLIPVRCCKKDVPQEWVVSILSKDPKLLNRYLEVRESQSPSYVAKVLDLDYEKSVTDLGLKICPKCRRGVEKKDGCIHIICLCRNEFCYTCGANWTPTRQCKCELYPQEEINRILDNRPELNERERLNLQNALRNHNEHNHVWTRIYITGKYKKCQYCNWVCNQWYFRCDSYNACSEIRCGRCTLNRD